MPVGTPSVIPYKHFLEIYKICKIIIIIYSTGIRYRADDAQLRYAHTVNGTACAIPRMLIALLENFQNSDYTITIPAPLRPFMRGKERISRKKLLPELKLTKRLTQEEICQSFNGKYKRSSINALSAVHVIKLMITNAERLNYGRNTPLLHFICPFGELCPHMEENPKNLTERKIFA